MRWALASFLGFILCLPPATSSGQWEGVPKASLPNVPYWWKPINEQDVGLVPLAWANDVDGGGSGCCVLGAATRYRNGTATLWLGLGFGTDPEAGTPAAIEAAAEINGGVIAYRQLHGRGGFSGFYPVYLRPGSTEGELDRVSVGVSAVWLNDTRYLETVGLFDCPDAPAVACREFEAPYPWTDGKDHAVAVEAGLGRGDWRVPRLRGSLVVGLKALGGAQSYARVEAEALVVDTVGGARLDARVGLGLTTAKTPLQRRFQLDGADPISRWLNPYLEADGALLADANYFTPGGPHLRAYGETRPLAKRYLAALAELSRQGYTRGGFWGRASAFLEAAWTPGLPDRFGPEQMNQDGDLLFDWRELPDGEDQPQGQFRARALEVSEFWADAGLAFSGGHEMIAVTLSFPLWASAPAFASEPITGEKKAFALRWALTFTFFPLGSRGQ